MNPFSLPFMQTALAAGLLAGNALALMGLFILLRGVSFSGLAVSQLAALGAVTGAVLGLHFGAFGAALLFVFGGLLLVQRLDRHGGAPRDAWIAALYALAAGAAVLILAKAPHGEAHTMTIFFGNLLALSEHQVIEAAGLLAAVILLILPFLHRWIWISFDPLPASVAGIRAGAWAAAFLALFALTMTVAIHLFGVLLSFALLLLPAATALVLSRSLSRLFLLIPVVASAAVAGGLWLSFVWDFPSGPFIICLLAAACLAAGFLRSLRGA